MRRRYRKVSGESAEKALEIGRVHVVLSLLEDGFEALNLVLIFSLGVCLYLSGGIDLGSVLSFLFLQDGISYMISNLREFFAGINSQKVCCSRVDELLNLEQEGVLQAAEVETPKQQGKILENMNHAWKQNKEILKVKSGIQERKESAQKDAPTGDIKVVNLSFQYPSGAKQVFENLNLTISRGKITLLSGVSGSGKSTLLKLLLALYSPEKIHFCKLILTSRFQLILCDGQRNFRIAHWALSFRDCCIS